MAKYTMTKLDIERGIRFWRQREVFHARETMLTTNEERRAYHEDKRMNAAIHFNELEQRIERHDHD